MVSIAKLIRDARAAAGLSQEELAQKLEVSRQTVQQWEKGTSGPKRERAIHVARILKIDVRNLDPLIVVDSVAEESHKIPLLRIEKTILKSGDARDLPSSLRAYADDMLAVQKSLAECFAVCVRDNSMKPLYVEGDICIVDPKLLPSDNDVVVASFPEEALILRTYVSRGVDSAGFASFDLTTPNADLTTYTVNSKNPADILGVVVEFRRSVRKR